MKKILRSVVYSSISAFVLCLSCQREEVAVSTDKSSKADNSDEIAYLSKERVRVPKGVEESAILITDKAKAAEYVANIFNNSQGRIAALGGADLADLPAILLEKKKNYPTLDFSLDQLPTDQFTRIQQDFPDIKTQEEAYSKHEVIALYYENRLRYDFIEALKNYAPPASSKGRLKGLDSGSLPGGWGWLAATYPTACAHAQMAKGQVNQRADAHFPGSNRDGFRSNAFYHAGWCGLVARKNIASGASKQNGVGEASIVCSAYECASVNFDPSQPNSIYMAQTRSKEAAMDLYNNSIGRSYIYHNTTYGVFGIRKSFPSEEYFLNVMRDRNCIENSFHATATTVEQILSYVQPDQEAAWTTLYRHTESDWYSFVRLYDGQDCY